MLQLSPVGSLRYSRWRPKWLSRHILFISISWPPDVLQMQLQCLFRCFKHQHFTDFVFTSSNRHCSVSLRLSFRETNNVFRCRERFSHIRWPRYEYADQWVRLPACVCIAVIAVGSFDLQCRNMHNTDRRVCWIHVNSEYTSAWIYLQNQTNYTKKVKVKVADTQLQSIRFQSWSGFLAVSLQVMWVINPAVGCHYFPPGLQLPPQPLRRGLLPILLLDEQRHNGCEQFAYDCYPTASRLRFESGSFCAWVQHANHSATEPSGITLRNSKYQFNLSSYFTTRLPINLCNRWTVSVNAPRSARRQVWAAAATPASLSADSASRRGTRAPHPDDLPHDTQHQPTPYRPVLPSRLSYCRSGVNKSTRPVKIEWRSTGVVFCLQRCADCFCMWSSWCHCHPETP